MALAHVVVAVDAMTCASCEAAVDGAVAAADASVELVSGASALHGDLTVTRSGSSKKVKYVNKKIFFCGVTRREQPHAGHVCYCRRLWIAASLRKSSKCTASRG